MAGTDESAAGAGRGAMLGLIRAWNECTGSPDASECDLSIFKCLKWPKVEQTIKLECVNKRTRRQSLLYVWFYSVVSLGVSRGLVPLLDLLPVTGTLRQMTVDQLDQLPAKHPVEESVCPFEERVIGEGKE